METVTVTLTAAQVQTIGAALNQAQQNIALTIKSLNEQIEAQVAPPAAPPPEEPDAQ